MAVRSRLGRLACLFVVSGNGVYEGDYLNGRKEGEGRFFAIRCAHVHNMGMDMHTYTT